MELNMLHIESIVTSLEISRKLNDFGINQRSFLYWDSANNFKALSFMPENDPVYNRYSAFTASELLNMLPNVIQTKEGYPFDVFMLNIRKSKFVEENNRIKDIYSVNYHSTTFEFKEQEFVCPKPKLIEKNVLDENFSDCLGKLLIELIEKNFVTVEQIDELGS